MLCTHISQLGHTISLPFFRNLKFYKETTKMQLEKTFLRFLWKKTDLEILNDYEKMFPYKTIMISNFFS